MKNKKILAIVMIFAALLIGCSQKPQQQTTDDSSQVELVEMDIMAAGATFPFPLYSKMFDEYAKIRGPKVNYNAIGSGGGINQLIEKTVDFGGTDAPMKADDFEKAGAEIVHIPTVLGAVVVSYNLPDNPPLKLTDQVIADIFLGNIVKWNDPKITEINPEISLPDMEIIVVHRSDGSGTTHIFSDYLTKVSPEWADKVGAGKSLEWPVGIGANGNPGVAGQISSTPGAVGYTELIYALSNSMPVASVRNKSGNFITPSIASVSSAAAIDLPADMIVSLTDTDAPEGYPISGLTWLILYKDQNYGGRSEELAKEIVNLIWWMTHEGQVYCEELHYAPLPQDAIGDIETLIKSINYGGKPLM
ncbi:phosphate ABC transporter substrate-binding protein PstS [candidate division WOR-3 bacterium]|nr:phosphate ABC transporter substrate-binding protein PstS [candidate division WOR-3 bacterium]